MPTTSTYLGAPRVQTTISSSLENDGNGGTRWRSNAPLYFTTSYAALTVDKTWVRTPNFRVLRKQGKLPQNNFSYSVRAIGPHQFTRGFSSRTYRETLSQTHWSGAQYPNLSPLGSEMDALRNRAVAKLLDEAKGEQWNVPVFIAEAGKTANMVMGRALDFVDMARALRRGDFRWFCSLLRGSVTPAPSETKRFNRMFGRDPVQAAANTWLEYKYGWMPMIKDVGDAMKALVELADDRNTLIGTARGSAKSHQGVKTFINNSNHEGVLISYAYTDRIVRSKRMVWMYQIKEGYLPGRFGFTNVLEVGWEAAPLSFVVDWFFPIGQYLSQLDTEVRFDSLGYTEGTRLEVNRKYEITKWPLGYVFQLANNQSFQLDVTRSKSAGFPSQKLSGVFSFENTRFKCAQAASAIALLAQFGSRTNRR